jgi:uncharacterized protein YecA (UPF0149 family)
MGMEKFYRTVRQKFGLNKEELKKEVRDEVTDELRDDLEEEISYIEAQMKEYEQLVAEVNHLLATMRKQKMKEGKSGQIRMDDFEDNDIEPLKSKLRELEKSMKERVEKQQALG